MGPDGYEFEGFRVDTQQRLLLAMPGRVRVDLQPRVFDTLLYFIERPGELLVKRELLAALWPGVIVEENSLNQVVSQLRKALGEKPSEHRYIVTAPGRGYRWVAAVHGSARQAAATTSAAPLPPPPAPDDVHPDSHFAYLKALSLSQQLSTESIWRTIELLRESVALSPQFARAHSLLAIQCTRAVMFGLGGPDLLELARQEVPVALELEESNGETWSAAGVIDCLDGNWRRAEERFRMAEGLISDAMVTGLHCACLTFSVGQLQRALQQAETTLRIAPAHPIGIQNMAVLHLARGNDAQARRYAQLALDMGQPQQVAPLADLLAMVAYRAGSTAEMAAILATPVDPPTRKRMLLWHTLQGDLDAAYELGFASLDAYAREGTVGSAWGVLWLPEMQPFRADERFQLFARRLRLFEYWIEYGPPDGYALKGERLVVASTSDRAS
jgi:DNA-binding winged helix-turn-helix (wHTH) protein/Flp pilus assembly protein TadD